MFALGCFDQKQTLLKSNVSCKVTLFANALMAIPLYREFMEHEKL